MDPSGHTPDCWDDEYACGADPAIVYENPWSNTTNPSDPQLPDVGNPTFRDDIGDALSTIATGADLISYGINLGQAAIIDGIGGVFISIMTFVGPDGPVDAITAVLILDIAMSSKTPLGVVENALGFVSLGATAGADFFYGNTDPAAGTIGVDTIVAARSAILGLIPEVNIDAVVSANQIIYDFERADGLLPGGSIPISFDAIFQTLKFIGWPVFD